MKIGKKVLAVFMGIMLLSFGSLSSITSYAQESKLDQKVYESLEKAKDLTDDLEKVEGEQAEKYVKNLENLLKDGSIKFKSNGNVDLENVIIMQNQKNKEVVLQIPLFFSEDKNELATVYFSSEGELKSYMENHYSANLKSYKVQIETWTDNEKILDNTVQLEAKHFEKEQKKEDEGFLSSLNPFSVKTASANSFTDFLRGFNNCLASQGIAAWAITAAGIACAGLGPAGASACYYGLSFLTGGVVGYCWTSAKYYQ